jgi:S1-C subfamily serine protease
MAYSVCMSSPFIQGGISKMEQTTNSTSLLRTLSDQMADAVERVSTALVVVNGRQRQAASGIVYGKDLVLTAAHVLERDREITIQTHDRRKLPATLVGRDPGSDLALLRVANLGLGAVTVSTELARVGQLVLAIGRDDDDGPMASVGIVSSVGGPLRTERGIVLEKYIQTDAISYPGFSGGPLIDTQGAVKGLLTTGLIGGAVLAIPMTIASTLADTLLKQGTIKRGYLGIASQLINIPTVQRVGRSQEHGLLLVRVDENSPAQRGGLLIGDILITLDGHAINDAEDLQLLLAGERVGKAVPVEVIRGNVLQTLLVTIGQRL